MLNRSYGYIRKHIKMTLALIIIGIIAVSLTLITYFTSWSDVNVTYTLPADAPIGSEAFYQGVESITGPMQPLPQGGMEILNNGSEFMPDLLTQIRSATSSITVANYIFASGTMLDQILDALTEKAKEGVAVRVLMDGKGSIGNPQDKVRALEDASGKIAIFRPIWNLRTIIRGNKRTHLRAIVIDGKVGYLGGMAFDDGWLGDATKPEEWRDEMFKVTGYGAQSVQDMFNDLWRQTTGEILTGPAFYPALPPAALPCRTSCFAPLFHAPTPDLEKNLSQLMWLSAQGAQNHIYLETPYLLPDDNMLHALEDKARSGVDVEIVVPGPYVDSRLVQAASRSYYEEMLKAGIKIYEYQPAHLHTKILTADGRWSVVGSANLDNRSATLNVEGVFGVEDTGLASDLEKNFLLDRSRSTEITLGSYQTNLFTRAFGRFSRLFAKQY